MKHYSLLSAALPKINEMFKAEKWPSTGWTSAAAYLFHLSIGTSPSPSLPLSISPLLYPLSVSTARPVGLRELRDSLTHTLRRQQMQGKGRNNRQPALLGVRTNTQLDG